jgi:hypothetical protein
LADLIELLEREHAHLQRLEGIDFLRRLPTYVELLTTQRQIEDVLVEMRNEAAEAQQRFVDKQNELEARAIGVRNSIAERADDVDDSDAEEPDDFGSHAYSDYMFTDSRIRSSLRMILSVDRSRR